MNVWRSSRIAGLECAFRCLIFSLPTDQSAHPTPVLKQAHPNPHAIRSRSALLRTTHSACDAGGTRYRPERCHRQRGEHHGATECARTGEQYAPGCESVASLWTASYPGGCSVAANKPGLSRSGVVVGWFAILFVSGFLLFWGWRRWPRWGDNTHTLIIGFAVAILIGILVWCTWYISVYSISVFADRVGQGYVARIILGFVLGIATAYVVEQRSIVRKAQLDAQTRFRLRASLPPRERSARADAPDSSIIEAVGGTSLTLLMWIAVVVLSFAISAPHLDSWLRHTTSLKLPFGELQIASTSTHAVLQADRLDLLADVRSLELLSRYNVRIRDDVDYLKLVEIEDLRDSQKEFPNYSLEYQDYQSKIEKTQELVDAINALLPVFDGLISSIASCVRDASSNGLGIDSIRLKVRPMADALDRVLFLEQTNGTDDSYAAAHNKLWEELTGLPSKIDGFLNDEERKQCSNSVKIYKLNSRSPVTAAYPSLKGYRDVSYLYVAAMLFSTFVRDDDVALKIIERIKDRPGFFRDYSFLLVASDLAYNQGSSITTVFSMLDSMRKTAREHREKIELELEKCEQSRCDQVKINALKALRRRERTAELQATNNLAYFIAAELADGTKAAEQYAARAEELADELRLALDKSEDNENRYSYLDTYAYVTLVLEARKKEPSLATFKTMAEHLEKVVEELERSVSSGKASKTDISALKLARAHRAAARELAGQ